MNKTADEYLDEDIRSEYAKHHSAYRVAKALGITLDRVYSAIGNEKLSVKHTPTVYGGRGRPELEKFIVALKHVNEPWDNSSEELRKARQRFEAGTHEMCQGRDGDTIIQYSIPRAVTEPRVGFFKHGD